MGKTKKKVTTKMAIHFKDKTRIFSHEQNTDPMRVKIFDENDIHEIAKNVPDEKFLENDTHFLEILNSVTGVILSFFPISTLKTPGKTDEKLLLHEINKSIHKTINDLSILLNQYSHPTISLLQIIDPDLKKADPRAYLEDIIRKLKSLSYTIPSALNKLEWSDLLLIRKNGEAHPTDQEMSELSEANNNIPVLIKVDDKYLIWGKKNKKWQKTEILSTDSSVLEYISFEENGRIVNIGDQFKNPEKIKALTCGHDNLKNKKGKKTGNNSQIAIKYLIAELARVYEQFTQRKASDDIKNAKNSSLGLQGKFYNFIHSVLNIINRKYAAIFPGTINPFFIELGLREETKYPHLSLSGHIQRTLESIILT